MYATNYFENLMVNLMRNQQITAPAQMYIGLFLSNPTDTGTAGTEISYSGYARQAINFSAPAASGPGMMIQNNAEINFPQSPINAGSVTYVGIFDSQQGGNLWLYSALDTPLAVQANVAPIFREASVKWIWTGQLTTYYKIAIMNTLRGTNLPGFNPFIALCNGDPTGAGTEFSGNNYARIPVTMSAPSQQGGAAQSANSADAKSNIASGNWGTLNTVAICDLLTGGNVFAVQSIASYAINTNYDVIFKAGNLTVSID